LICDLLDAKKCFIKNEYLFTFNPASIKNFKEDLSRKSLTTLFKSKLEIAVKQTSKLLNKENTIISLKYQQSLFMFNSKTSNNIELNVMQSAAKKSPFFIRKNGL
jgi:hypothetical protein